MKNISLNQKQIFVENSALTEDDFLSFCINFLNKNQEEYKKNPPGFFEILDNQEVLDEIIDFADKNQKKWKEIVVCGIGGSALGTKAVYNALSPNKKITILETIDPEILASVAQKSLADTLFVFISKSGTTLETVSQFFFFKNELKKQGLDWKKNSIFITGETGKFREIANKNKVKTFTVPEKVGGRFSVFTPVGLVPLALAGVDIAELIEGAKLGRKNALSKNPKKNTALKMAVSEFLLKKNTSVFFVYEEKLESVGRFWRQLLAESIGRTKKIGILPHIAIGTRDQHSDLQLFAEGPADKLYTFIIEKNAKKASLPTIKDPDFAHLSKKSFSEIKKASLKGTAKSLTEKKQTVQIMEIEEINEESIGELLFTFEAEIAFLGKMFGINPFNQPGVENGKKITKKLLS